MEKSSVIGIAAGFVLVYGAIFMGDGWQTFFDPASAVLVLGGTTSALLVNFTIADLKSMPARIKDFFTFQKPDLLQYVTQFYELARVARREGLLALDRRISELEDDFMRFGLEMAVDGIDEAEINDLMLDRIKAEASERSLAQKFFVSAGSYAPAFGMVGTLIGLIQMLQNLTDPSQIGSGMAVALITTFYGALLANLVFLPVSSKLKAQSQLLIQARTLVHMGVMGIVRGESPSMIDKRLRLLAGNGEGGKGEEAEAAELARAA